MRLCCPSSTTSHRCRGPAWGAIPRAGPHGSFPILIDQGGISRCAWESTLVSDTQATRPDLIPVDFDPFADRTARVLPLTPSQTEMWTAIQLGPEASCSYNQCFVLALRGPISAESMERALQTVVDRHESLRTTFDPDGCTQRVADRVSVSLKRRDLSSQTPARRAAGIEKVVAAEVRRPFDLERGPLFRAQLVEERANCYRLILTVSHIVCDGWSSGVLFTDLARAYAADRHGITASLLPASSYCQYVLDEAAAVGGATHEQAREYWER